MSYQIEQTNKTNQFSPVVQTLFNNSTGYLIDVMIYGNIPNEFETSHYDKSQSYIAFVTFGNNYSKCTISWNLKAKDIEQHYGLLIDYMNKNEKEIKDVALKAFTKAYPVFGKSWA